LGAKHLKNQVRRANHECARWSNRLLIVSLAGIGYLTLFPFKFDFAALRSTYASAFLLGESFKPGGRFDIFLNVLLFVPFGFAVSSQLRKRGFSRAGGFILALAAGFLTSYVVELLQYYIPTRSSAWDDVTPNSIGALAGFLIFEFSGGVLLRILSKCEDTLEGWLSPLRTVVLLFVYFGLWFGVSIPLQQQTRLSNWDTQSGLFVGNDASGRNAWKGQVSRLQIWNRALPEGLVHQITTDGQAPDAGSGLLVTYDFTAPAPYVDHRNLLPPLARVSAKSHSGNDARALEMDGTSWLGTESPVGELIRRIQATNQFTIRIVCTPAGIRGADGRIFSISQSVDKVDLHLRQEGTNLVLFFRTPIAERRSNLVWYVRGVFSAGQARDIVATYDGSDASIYVDGKRTGGSYRLSAATSFARNFVHANTANLSGYVVVYETLIFLPAGLLIGMAARKWSTLEAGSRLLFAACMVLPPVILEIILVVVSGRKILPGNIFLSLLFFVAGVCLINADGYAPKFLTDLNLKETA
jgi:glycopeptide antibiotics resistance protein